MKKDIMCLSKKTELLLKVILTISSPFFTILLSNEYEYDYILPGAILSFVIVLYLMLRKVNINKLNLKVLIISTIVGAFCVNGWLSYSNEYFNVPVLDKIIFSIFMVKWPYLRLFKILGIMSLPITIFFVYLFIEQIIPKIKDFLLSFSNSEKRYFVIVLILSMIASITITHYTSAFSMPYDNRVVDYDVIYTSDSGALVKHDAFFNVGYYENDIRQPLFGIFSLPFSIPARIIAQSLSFLSYDYVYCVIMTVVQVCLLSVTIILLCRLLKLKDENKKYLYLLFHCSFPYILFGLVLEQYVIGLFYLILAIYFYSINSNKINYIYIGATGTLITSGIIFPLIIKFKNIKQWLLSGIKCFLLFCSILIIGGQFPQVLMFRDKLDLLMNGYTGKVDFLSKLFQFTHFVREIFIANSGKIEYLTDHYSYQLSQYTSVSILGILLIVMCFISYLLNKKNKMAIISILWLTFSAVILLIVGWGTAENGLILYSLYFSWAYMILYYLLLKKIFTKHNWFKFVVAISCIIMLYFNINEFIEIFKFAVKYY